MSWNGSGDRGAAAQGGAEQPRGGSTRKARPAIGRGIAAGLVVVVLGGAAAWFVLKGRTPEAKPEAGADKPSLIKEVAPAAAPKAETNAVPAKPKIPTYRDERGILRYKGGLRAPDPTRPKVKPVKSGVDSKGNPLWKRSIFTNPAEREICRLLTLEPGRPLIGTVLYNKRFEEAYKKSLETPIIVTEEDSPSDAALKRAMIDAKQEISDRMAKGEKLADILKESRSELERLAKYKRDVEKMVREESSREGVTENEAIDLVNAANKMLKENGIAPIRNGVLARRNLMLKIQERREKQKK